MDSVSTDNRSQLFPSGPTRFKMKKCYPDPTLKFIFRETMSNWIESGVKLHDQSTVQISCRHDSNPFCCDTEIDFDSITEIAFDLIQK